MSYDDLKEYGTEALVKAAGKLRQQGKPCELSCLWRTTTFFFKERYILTDLVLSF